MAFTSKLSTEERLLRKRQAARIRQQRCRARKRKALLDEQTKEEEERSVESSSAGSETGTARSTERSTSKVSPPRYSSEHSPRSVAWSEIPHSSWIMPPPPGAIDFPHGHPAFDYKPRRRWPYKPAHMVANHFDAQTKDHMYSRYHQRMPLSRPQVRPYARTVPQTFIPINLPVPRYYAYPNREPELKRTHEEFAKLIKETSRSKLVTPKLPELKKTEAEPMESKEEAAIDAILALKAGEIIVPPPKIQRVSSEPKSAFQNYRHVPRPRPTRPGFYLTMRS